MGEDGEYGFLTFNPHPSDTKEFVQEFQSLLQPIIAKSNKFIFVREKKGTPAEHIHFLLVDNFKDTSKFKQKIENKSIKSFISTRIKQSNTSYEHAFKYLKIPNTQEDHMYYIGYVCKEEDCRPIMKNFSHEEITEAVNYYHTVERNKASKIDNSWKHLKPNELHCYMEHYSAKLEMKLDDPCLILEMVKNKISFNQITERQMRKTKQELWIAHKDDVHHTSYTVAEKDLLNDIHEDDWMYWKQVAIQREERIEELKKEIHQLKCFNKN